MGWRYDPGTPDIQPIRHPQLGGRLPDEIVAPGSPGAWMEVRPGWTATPGQADPELPDDFVCDDPHVAGRGARQGTRASGVAPKARISNRYNLTTTAPPMTATTTPSFPCHPATAHQARAREAADAWVDVLTGARRQPTLRLDAQFRREVTAHWALTLAANVRDGLGRMAGCSVEHFVSVEPNDGRAGYHIHQLLWNDVGLIPAAVKRRWERRASSVRLVTLWGREDEACEGPCPTDRANVRPVRRGVRYAVKRYHDPATEWTMSPHLLRRIDALT